MPRIGSFEYPNASIQDVIRLAKQIVGEGDKGRSGKKKQGAETRRKGSDESARLKELQDFGILQLSEEELEPTSLAHRLAAPTNRDDYRSAVAEAAFNIPLFSALNETFAGRRVPLTERDFLAGLLVVTATDVDTARDHVKDVTQRFLDIARELGAGDQQDESRI